ncbi:MAG TPA: hypothetical protein VNH42_03475 [Mariprofundaceae bacterium]|nr:hypothetical protein [Mariprofundaceae bacterium]
MNNRPTSVTVIAWILIVLGSISLVTTTVMIGNPTVLALMQRSPLPVPVQYAINYIGLGVMIVSGAAMLKGRNWARYLYVIWSVIGLAIGFATSPMKATLLPGLVVVAIIVFFLFRPKASAYFSPDQAADDAQPA